ncbi:hypothetical protein TSUD_277910 [Trifolium subterraneum]|uniref:Uncharacterized protein n=1 Tax=Trifolium subterraneum TaxID=3900 RepID=A0A2Z6MKZ7_TRISU|nr:hypothetical protein TSUD_277910 [Trifolium subterraneum]
MKGYQKLLQPGSVAHSNTTRPADFEFNTGFTNSLSNDVVFRGKVISRKIEPDSTLQKKQMEGENMSDQKNVFVAGLRSPSGRENRWRGSDRDRKCYTGIFGTLQFPLQMGLSDIKMRQERMEPMTLSKFTAKNGGKKSCRELVRHRRTLMSIVGNLKSSFRIRCISAIA